MIELSRRVRFSISPGDEQKRGEAGRNTFAGWPAMIGLGAYYELEVICRGEADPETGWLLDISSIDAAVRKAAIPVIDQAFRRNPATDPADLLSEVLSALSDTLGESLAAVHWRLTPYYCVSMNATDRDTAVLTQTFEFAAAHRLHCRSLSPQENRALFGKCNNESGHGHNYRIEVSVAVPLARGGSGNGFSNIDLERIVHDQIIARFDHKNLDVDTEEFAGINSTVENIARICYERLEGPVRAAGADLKRIRIWETEKTSCAYPA